MTITPFVYIGAALAEIAGCYSFWAWRRLGKSPLWIVPGMVLLALFAWLLTLGWLWAVEGLRPDPWDATGAVICLVGATVILFGPPAA